MSDNVEYHLNKAQSLLVALLADTGTARKIRHEVVDIVMAWHSGVRAPRSAAPTLLTILDMFPKGPPWPDAS